MFNVIYLDLQYPHKYTHDFKPLLRAIGLVFFTKCARNNGLKSCVYFWRHCIPWCLCYIIFIKSFLLQSKYSSLIVFVWNVKIKHRERLIRTWWRHRPILTGSKGSHFCLRLKIVTDNHGEYIFKIFGRKATEKNQNIKQLFILSK